MCATTSESAKRIVHEREFARFLTKRIENFGGSIKLQHITGHLSQVEREVRDSVGTSKSDILRFIERHIDIFSIKNDIITLVNYSKKDNDYNSYIDSSIDSSLPNKISNGIGVIVKLLPTFGFIKVKEPVKTSVFFYAKTYLNSSHDEHVNLTDCNLNIGTMVNFNAVKEKKDKFTSKFCATRVWKNNEVDVENNIVYSPRKNRKTGLYDPVNLDGEGVIQKVFQNLGFIAVNGDGNNTVFFYKNRVVNYDNIVDLTEVFKPGDLVEFSAHRSTKQDTKARWEAIKVWNKSGKNAKVKRQEKDTASRSTTSIISSKQSASVSNPTHFTKEIEQKDSAREMMHDQSGQICLRSNGAVIKFGKDLTQLADGDSSIYYICGVQVTEISWEFSDGDRVKFDAVKIKSAPGWKAVLIWTGDKPNIVLPTCLGDFSAFSDEEIDEIPEDTNSLISVNHMSVSSRSSQKSISMKSEFSDFKSVGSSKETSSMQDSYNQTIINLTKKDNMCKRPSMHSLSPYSSQSNLSSSSESKFSGKSKNKLESDKSRRNRENNVCKSVTSFKDIPQSEVDVQIISPSKNNYLTDTQDDEHKSISGYSSVSFDINDDKTTGLSDQEFTNSSDESETNDNLENVTISECKEAEGKKTACLKNFQNIIGEVTKVYSTFAEVRSFELSNPVAFFWSIYYCEKKSMEELKLNDLREVLKVGDTVQFNYFEIVDDLGQTWNKVSLVWSGPKPLCKNEMTAKDFIQQNGLSVTVSNESSHVRPQQQIVERFQPTVKKFLIAVDDISLEDKTEECMSRTESCSYDDDDDCDETFHSPTSCEISEPQEKPMADKIKVFSDMISQKLLMNEDLFEDSKVDLNSLSAEIVNLVLERFKQKESSGCVSNTSSTNESSIKGTSNTSCSTCGKKVSEKTSQHKNTQNAEVQTIFTGEVMAQNIFTLC